MVLKDWVGTERTSQGGEVGQGKAWRQKTATQRAHRMKPSWLEQKVAVGGPREVDTGAL